MLAETGLTGPVPVTAVGSHDTASAVVGVPAIGRPVRLHLLRHVVAGRCRAGPRRCSPRRAGRRASPTSSASTARSATCATSWACGCCRSRCAPGRPPACRRPGRPARRGGAACRRSRPSSTPTTTRFLPPATCRPASPRPARGRGRPPPQSQAETVRCILDSLALAYRRTVRPAPPSCPGGDVEVVHLVGGGARNTLLCQLTADACGLPVLAGPVEAAALGNALVQARAGGVLERRPDRAAGAAAQAPRTCGSTCPPPVRSTPGRRPGSDWRPARRRPGAGASPGPASRTGPAARRSRRGTAAPR